MTAKEFLSRGRGIKERIERLKERRDRAFSRATDISAHLSLAPGGGTRESPQDKYLEELDKLDLLWGDKLAELYTIQADIERAAYQLTDRDQRDVIECRHIDELTLEKTAVKLNISYPQVCRIQGRAYLEIEKIINAKDETK
ncbi:hypothetical protein FACS1894105_14260 [Clostridia bacterium]|nr:hypothetical protein FACS1894105_14260 [Clostridia bacterium]